MNTYPKANGSIKAEIKWFEHALEGCTDGGIRKAIESRIAFAKLELASNAQSPFPQASRRHSR
jgi:hypothetical protein